MTKHIQSLIIAIDGHSSCGKSTVARDLARELKITYIDTGAMYRAVTLYALQNNLVNETGEVDEKGLKKALDKIDIRFVPNSKTGISDTYLNGENVENEIRRLEVSNNVSKISTIREVRKKLVDLQQKMGKKGGVVLDGRDIGTVVFPDADLKIFMTASADIRAKRRFDEMTAKGDNPSFEEILKNVRERDEMDTNRIESPLKKADDAWLLDNSHMTREEQLKWILEKVEKL